MSQKGLAPILIVVLIAVLAIGGYLIYKLPRATIPPPTPQIAPVPSPIPSPSPIPTDSAATANWKTYTNDSFFYAVNYPQNWELVKEKSKTSTERIWGGSLLLTKEKELDSVSFVNKSRSYQGLFSIHIIDNLNNLNLDQWIKQNTPKNTKTITDIKLSDIPAKKLSLDTFSYPADIGIVAIYKEYIYLIYMPFADLLPKAQNNSDLIEQKKIYDQILSTFRFLN